MFILEKKKRKVKRIEVKPSNFSKGILLLHLKSDKK